MHVNARGTKLVGAVIAVFLLSLSTAGCGQDSGPLSGSPAPDDPPSAGDGAPGPVIQVEGTVRRGVERGCLVLHTSDAVYLLLGPGAVDLSPGEVVVVAGVLSPQTATSCMQGSPLLVRDVRPGGGG